MGHSRGKREAVARYVEKALESNRQLQEMNFLVVEKSKSHPSVFY